MSIIGVVGGSQTFAQASGGKVYAAVNLGPTPTMCAPANVNRQKITFHNPGPVDIFVGPQFVLTFAGSQFANPASVALPAGSFRILSNGGTLVISGECQGQWNAFSESSTNIGLTVMDSNI